MKDVRFAVYDEPFDAAVQQIRQRADLHTRSRVRVSVSWVPPLITRNDINQGLQENTRLRHKLTATLLSHLYGQVCGRARATRGGSRLG